MNNQITIHEFEADFFCPMCGTKVFDGVTLDASACEHLRYVSLSDAPGSPYFIDDSLHGLDLSVVNELDNLKSVTKAVKGPVMQFKLGCSRGYLDLHLVFEVLYQD
jgi:hypothetical protein